MFRTLSRTLLASSALLLTACSGAASGGMGADDLADLDADTLRDEPVMFSVTDADSEVILFGTFHILPPETQWESQTLTDAIARSDEVWFELPKGAQEDPALQQLSMQLGMSDTPLSSRLDEPTRERLEAMAGSMDIPMAALDTMQPWMASLTLSMVQMMGAGFDPANGAEAVIEPRVEGKSRRSFETAEQQLRFFADMDEAAQVDMLVQSLDGLEDGPELMTRMATSWASGDVDMLEDEIINAAKTDAPGMYDVLFTRRNAAWADALDAKLKGSGTDFVAVGAGHLLGPDSVPVMLARKGYEVRVLTAE